MTDQTGGGGDVRSMLAGAGKTVFSNKRLLDPETIIGTERIVGRDEQLEDTVRLFRPFLHDESANDMMFYGPSGTGKSLIVEHVASETVLLAEEQGVDFEVFTLNCNSAKTADDAFYRLGKMIGKEVNADREIKKQGISTSEKIEYLFDLVSDHYDAVLFVLDEVDQLINTSRQEYAYSDVIYQLTRTTELGLEDTDVSVATISNNPTFMDNLGSRAFSSYHPSRVHFPDYNAPQLEEILENREDAFKSGVVGDGVLSLCAALAARDHGDARQAIDLLRHAGEMANNNGESVVTEDHVYQAEEIEQRNVLHEQISGLSSTKQQALYAVAVCCVYTPESVEKVPGPLVYGVFNHILQTMGDRSVSRASYFRYMNELETYMIVKSERKSFGQGSRVKLYQLPESAGTTMDVLHNNADLQDLGGKQDELRRVVEDLAEQSDVLRI